MGPDTMFLLWMKIDNAFYADSTSEMNDMSRWYQNYVSIMRTRFMLNMIQCLKLLDDDMKPTKMKELLKVCHYNGFQTYSSNLWFMNNCIWMNDDRFSIILIMIHIKSMVLRELLYQFLIFFMFENRKFYLNRTFAIRFTCIKWIGIRICIELQYNPMKWIRLRRCMEQIQNWISNNHMAKTV